LYRNDCVQYMYRLDIYVHSVIYDSGSVPAQSIFSLRGTSPEASTKSLMISSRGTPSKGRDVLRPYPLFDIVQVPQLWYSCMFIITFLTYVYTYIYVCTYSYLYIDPAPQESSGQQPPKTASSCVACPRQSARGVSGLGNPCLDTVVDF